MSKSRGWCFTLNNYEEKDIISLRTLDCVYAIWGKEIATTGTPHLQGYAYFKNAVTHLRLHKVIPRASTLIAKGTAKDNYKYCSKEGNFEEIGTLPKMGKRNDIHNARDMVKDGASMLEICETINSYQALKCAELFKRHYEQKRNWKTTVYWYYGSTGTGKSKMAHENFPDAFWALETAKWWDGYDGHKTIIIDDMRANFCTFNWLLKLLDRYPLTLEVKGGTRQLLAENIVITSPYPPDEIYLEREDIGQLLRRIDHLINFDNYDN